MPGLTDNEARAVAYFAIGVSSEGGDQAYRLSLAGNIAHDAQGHAVLQPVANSGYSIGTLQTDLGQAGQGVSTSLVDAYQAWARSNHPDWVLDAAHRTQTINDLSRNGRQINADDGRDLDASVKSHLNSFLASDAGVTFVHNRDVEQVDKLMTDVVTPLRASTLYRQASSDDQARLIAIAAKAYNQSERWGGQIVRDIGNGTYRNVADVSGAVNHMPDYMQSGRDAALRGAELFNALEHAGRDSPMHGPWQDVLANPLVNPTRLDADPAHPHLNPEYRTIKDAFVDPTHGRGMVNALERGGSYNYGNPATANARGFYAEGRDFVEWDRAGHGRAFVNGQWSELSRTDLTRTVNADHTVDLSIRRNGAEERLLHITHPTAVQGRGTGGEHVQVPGTLREHDRGAAVHDLQAQLAQLGYKDTKGHLLRADSDYGPGTKAAVEAFQRDHHLHPDGIAGSATMRALHDAQQARSQPSPGLNDATHPGHAIYRQALDAVHRLDAQQGRTSDQRSDNLAAALVVAAREHGMTRVDHVVLNDNASRAYAVQGDLNSPFKQYADVNVATAVMTPVAQSSAAWERANPPQPAQNQHVTPQQQTQQRTGPSMH
ncbi:MAG TPA: peptidoglycan-binding domain-containing protein [Dyella sp.]|uniref:peptidoglycan-binding domain-containing protein n=1 Tax=Dyella sp. TaxID=1869338 RepID=UPI002F921E6E